MILIWLTCCSELTVTSCSYRVPNSFNVVVHWHSMISHPASRIMSLFICTFLLSGLCQTLALVTAQHWRKFPVSSSPCSPVFGRSEKSKSSVKWSMRMWVNYCVAYDWQTTLIVSHQCPHPTCLKPSCVIYPCAGFALLSIEGSSFSGAGHLCPPLFLIDELQVGSWKLEFNNLLKINTVNATCGITHPLVNCACCTVPHLLHPHVNCKSGAAVKLWM